MELKNIKLIKGMNRDEVNKIISNWIELEDDFYIKASHPHNWRCKCGNIIEGRQWNNIRGRNSTKCNLCKGYARSGENLPYELSFAYYIEQELGLKIEDIWDYEKNIAHPYHIAKQCNDDIWIKCQKTDYHGSYKTKAYVIVKAFEKGNNGCPHCINRKVHHKDSIAEINPYVANMIYKDKNGDDVDVASIAPYSNKEFYIKCPNCNQISMTPKVLANIVTEGYGCAYCSDGIPYTEKFMANVLNQLGVHFKTQLNNSDFKWIGRYKYDFYIPDLNMIIETHGKQHYIQESSGRYSNLNSVQSNDMKKRELAINNGISQYIIIDCRISRLKWLKLNIENSLKEYFDMSNVNWNDAWMKCQDSDVVKTWNLWKSGIYSTIKIGKELNRTKGTIREYLKRGNELGVITYNPEDFKNFKQIVR